MGQIIKFGGREYEYKVVRRWIDYYVEIRTVNGNMISKNHKLYDYLEGYIPTTTMKEITDAYDEYKNNLNY